MHISVYSHDANPAVDPRSFRRSRAYCKAEVESGRAFFIDESNPDKGIQLLHSSGFRQKPHEMRGSPEASGSLSWRESLLNADYRGKNDEIHHLSLEYEFRLDQHISQGKKGLPRACSVIAARVKTILSDPRFGRAEAQEMRAGL